MIEPRQKKDVRYSKRERERKARTKGRKSCKVYELSAIILADLLDSLPFLLLKDSQGLNCFCASLSAT